ncbi:symmetrical bis(5'-nucleosyl)-tetraphosphatase [Aliikangiella sp. GXAS 306]
MATYAIGDIQGCYRTFKKLLKKIDFHPGRDQLWLAGDLINRGPSSLKTLEYIYKYQDSIQCVLGNHDLHFLAIESGQHLSNKKDTFKKILLSPNRKKLVKWLKTQPLFYMDEQLEFAMVHAGVPADWSFRDAVDFSQEVSEAIQSKNSYRFFAQMYNNTPSKWKESLSGIKRLRFITNALTRMRYCFSDGSLELTCKVPPGEQPAELTPWFELPQNLNKGQLIFGHWASLMGQCPIPHYYALDTGCVWGRKLTALRLDDKTIFQCKNID